MLLSAPGSAGESTVCCRRRPGVSSCSSCSASRPGSSTWCGRRASSRTKAHVEERASFPQAGRPGGALRDTGPMDPIHQFNIHKIFTIGHIGNQEIAFTNSSAYMLLAVAVIGLLMLATSRRLVPGRLQSVAEISYEFVANTIRSTAGAEGMKFFPLIF